MVDHRRFPCPSQLEISDGNGSLMRTIGGKHSPVVEKMSKSQNSSIEQGKGQ
jgi:hypothetical protein